MAIDRRSFLQLLSTSALAATFPDSIAKALSIPANNQTGTIADIEHIVILMQENRSFDHYFGTLNGIRGFGDPRAVTLPSGDPVWYQPDGQGGYVLPFHPTAPDLGLQFIEDLAHDWTSTHEAWNNGNNDQWVPSKGPVTMAHLTRSDIPYHYALADAFTICDAYHASLLGPTDPNRYHMWTGWVGNDGSGGGPVIDNAEAGYGWSTYPEQLQKAGISWKIYQDAGLGLNAANYWGYTDDAYIGNYGDNSLLYFHQYQNAPDSSPLAIKARTGTNIAVSGTLFDIFRQDVLNNTLPQVSWIVAPEAYTEHPNWPANYGAWYVSQMLDALTANPEVWSKTAFLLTYDENDGFFDHMVPPTPPQTRAEGYSTVDIKNEIFPGDSEYPAGPYGLGLRVPMVVISPWSKGGYVNSQVFDHTSIIRFIQARFGPNNPALTDNNITQWRSAVSGDLTSAFNFKTPNDAKVQLPSTSAYKPLDSNRHPDYTPAPPTEQAMPLQETGTRPARPLPYVMNAWGDASLTAGTFEINMQNTGSQTVVFQVRSGDAKIGPRTYTVKPAASAVDIWQIAAAGDTGYDLSVYGPNGFYRGYKGLINSASAASFHTLVYADLVGNTINLAAQNRGDKTFNLQVRNVYTGEVVTENVARGVTFQQSWPLAAFSGWYDLVLEVESDAAFRQELAGHIETGKDSTTDPAIAAVSVG